MSLLLDQIRLQINLLSVCYSKTLLTPLTSGGSPNFLAHFAALRFPPIEDVSRLLSDRYFYAGCLPPRLTFDEDCCMLAICVAC